MTDRLPRNAGRRAVSSFAVGVALTAAMLLAPRQAAGAGLIREVAVDVVGQATRVQLSVRGEVQHHDFTLRNPERLVIDFRGASSALPPRLPADGMAGLVSGVQISTWEGEGEEPVTRLVLELARRASYSIARHDEMIVIVLESGSPSAAELGYDEDHLAMVQPVEHGAVSQAGDKIELSGPRRFSANVYGRGSRLEDPPSDTLPDWSSARRVSLDVQKANMMTVVRTLGQLAQRNIVTNAEVGGEVTLRLDDVPWPQALDIVLLTQGLGFTDEEGVIRIASLEALRTEEVKREEAARKREELMPVRTQVMAVNFAKAEELKTAVEKMLSGRGHAEVDNRTNSLIVTDIDEKVRMAGSLVTQLDARTPQVEIEARMVDVDASESWDRGIDWTFSVTQQGSGDLNHPQSFSSINSIANPAGELRVGAMRDDWTLDGVLQALVNDRKANIISNPRITTVNNREASILVGQEIPLVVQDAAFNTVVQLKQIGIKLTVRPHINSDRQIELDIHPEVSDLASQATVQGGIIINTSEADTRVLVDDGQTAVIGGLIRENDTLTERGIPLLKDVPALGWLFKSTSNVKQKRELLIFITPRIVDG